MKKPPSSVLARGEAATELDTPLQREVWRYKQGSSQAGFWKLDRLDTWEAGLIRPMVVTEGSRPWALAVAINHLTNGWLFAAITILMPLTAGGVGWRFVRIVAIALPIAFTIYTIVKLALARVRPCHAYASLDARVAPMDLYSCPSGHTMTAAMYAVVLGSLFPAATAALVATVGLVGWSRLSLGHHYPTDVVLGGLLGAATALPLSVLLP